MRSLMGVPEIDAVTCRITGSSGIVPQGTMCFTTYVSAYDEPVSTLRCKGTRKSANSFASFVRLQTELHARPFARRRPSTCT